MHRSLLCLLALACAPLCAQDFTGSFTLVAAHTSPSGGERQDSITYHFQGPITAMVIHGRGGQPDVRMLFDPSAKTITQLFQMNGRRGGFLFPMTEQRWPGMKYADALPSVEVGEAAYTGRERSIEGHLCRELQAVNDKYNATVWVAEDIPLSMLRVFSYQSVGAGKSTEEAELYRQMSIKGFPLEMQLTSTTGKPDVVLRVVRLTDHVDPGVFSTEGYAVSEVTE